MALKSVLFTWEIGQGFGHVMPLLPIARELKARGHRIAFALRDVRAAGALLKAEGFTVIQAPTHPDQFFPANGPQPQTMADILEIFGFASSRNLSGLVAAWEGLFSLCSPDVVVASYAPLSLLCAGSAGIPTVLMALPFELPSSTHPSPVIRTGKTPNTTAADDRVISNVNKVFGLQSVSTIHEIFKADKTFIMSFPELDSLYPRPQVEYCESFFVTDVGVSPKWPSRQGKRIFAYLNSELPNLEALRSAIHNSIHSYCIVLRGASDTLIEKWRAVNVCVSAEVIKLNTALPQCDAVLTYGGHGLVSACLLAGKPMTFLIRDLEPYLNAMQVVKIGAGVMPQPQTIASIMTGLDQILQNPSFKNAAVNFAQSRSSVPLLQLSKLVADRIERTMARQTATELSSAPTT